MKKLRIATAQFPICANIARNLKHVTALMARAARLRADVVHFSEASLGGYAGRDFRTWKNYDWGRLRKAEEELLKAAGDLKIGVIYGTNRRVSGGGIRNSLIYVSAGGRRVARYDKRFCTSGDLKFYKSGRRCAIFDIKGIRCGLLICYDVRFPELYRAYKKLNARVMFHSFYNARARKANIHTTIMRPSLQDRAATNYLYISANNSSGYYQSWPSVFILPDGTIAAACKRHRTCLIVNEISLKDKYYDASGPYRKRAMSGVLYSE